MLNPSYTQLIDIVNEEIAEGEKIDSRYSIIIAASKRARQIIGGAKYDAALTKSDKAIAVAISEIENGLISIIPSKEQDIINLPDIEQTLPTVVADDNFIKTVDEDELDDFDMDDDLEMGDLFEYDPDLVEPDMEDFDDEDEEEDDDEDEEDEEEE